MTRKIRRNMAKREARQSGQPLKKVWPKYLLGPSRDPKVRPHRSMKAIEREINGHEKLLKFLERSFWIAALGYVPEKEQS